MSKKTFFLLLLLFILGGCSLPGELQGRTDSVMRGLNNILQGSPVATYNILHADDLLPTEFYLTLFETLDFEYEIPVEIISNTFLINLIHHTVANPNWPNRSILLTLDNGNELLISPSDFVIFLVSYREQESDAHFQTQWQWWTLGLATVDIRDNSIFWDSRNGNPFAN